MNTDKIQLSLLDKEGVRWAQETVTRWHYLHRPMDPRTMPEGYAVYLGGRDPVGLLLFGRPEATKVNGWYGGVEGVTRGYFEVTRWQVLNLARVYFVPAVQEGGLCFDRVYLPGFVDRRGVWRSTLASSAIRLALGRIGFDYLIKRPPCFLDEPYEIMWVLSYCDTRLHKGMVYRGSGFEQFRKNEKGIETWRVRVKGLSGNQDDCVREAARVSPRSQRMRVKRAQMTFDWR